jgi:thioredoxin domain-containing protein 5
VKGYPQLNLYRNGEFVEKYRKPRDFSLLLEYIALHAEKTAEPAEPNPVETTPANNSPELTTPRKDYNPDGTVVSLDPKTFDAALVDGPIFIKFFAPWCGHCKKLAPHWTQLAVHMRHKMTIAEVNCEDHGSLCKKQGVEGYPALFFYPGPGAEKTEYMGGRKIEQLSAFADKATEP